MSKIVNVILSRTQRQMRGMKYAMMATFKAFLEPNLKKNLLPIKVIKSMYFLKYMNHTETVRISCYNPPSRYKSTIF